MREFFRREQVSNSCGACEMRGDSSVNAGLDTEPLKLVSRCADTQRFVYWLVVFVIAHEVRIQIACALTASLLEMVKNAGLGPIENNLLRCFFVLGVTELQPHTSIRRHENVSDLTWE